MEKALITGGVCYDEFELLRAGEVVDARVDDVSGLMGCHHVILHAHFVLDFSIMMSLAKPEPQ